MTKSQGLHYLTVVGIDNLLLTLEKFSEGTEVVEIELLQFFSYFFILPRRKNMHFGKKKICPKEYITKKYIKFRLATTNMVAHSHIRPLK